MLTIDLLDFEELSLVSLQQFLSGSALFVRHKRLQLDGNFHFLRLVDFAGTDANLVALIALKKISVTKCLGVTYSLRRGISKSYNSWGSFSSCSNGIYASYSRLLSD